MKSVYHIFLKCIVLLVISACVDPIQFEMASSSSLLVVEARIDNSPGPYVLQLSRSVSLDAASAERVPVQGASIQLFDDLGRVDQYIEKQPGLYETSGAVRGQTGRSYYVRIETTDGDVFESEPDPMLPVGDINEIRQEFEARTVVETFGEVKADVFNIYIDAEAGGAQDTYVRWRFTGTYEAETYPSLHMTHTPPYRPYKDPWPCSGYILVGGPEGSGGLLQQVGGCTCCSCWAQHYEDVMQLSDVSLVANGKFQNVKVGEVPINNATFHKKYMVEVEQMSLSEQTFKTFELIRNQKTNASSLFQPPSGEIIGNVRAVNNSKPVVGIVWATAIAKKTLFLLPSDVPYPLTPIDFITLPCQDFYGNASNQPPAAWE